MGVDGKKLLAVVLCIVAVIAIATVVFMQKKQADQAHKALPYEPPSWFGKGNTGRLQGGSNQAPAWFGQQTPRTAPR
jgi:hypothetical protein